MRPCLPVWSAGVNSEGREVYLRDIWPTREEIQAVERTFVIPSMFKEVYRKIEVPPPVAVDEDGVQARD